MDAFFEVFEHRLVEEGFGRLDAEHAVGVLETMRLGEPITAIVEHKFHQDSTKTEMDEDTMIVAHPFKFGCDAEIWFRGHHGTDGEEVVVLVVRMGSE